MNIKSTSLIVMLVASTQINAVGFSDYIKLVGSIAKTIVLQPLSQPVAMTDEPTIEEMSGNLLLNNFSEEQKEIIRQKLERGEEVVKSSGINIYLDYRTTNS